jgi:hypothetical protein
LSRIEENRLQPIWAFIARELGVQVYPEELKFILLNNYETEINAALGTWEEEDLRPVVQAAVSMYSALHLPVPARRGRKRTLEEDSKTTMPEVGWYERLRSRVLSGYLGKIASLEPDVVHFRSDVLAGEYLTSNQARIFLSSPASRYLGRDVWKAFEIPAEHSATLLAEDFELTEDGPIHWVQMRIDPPGETHAVFVPNPQSYGDLTYLAENGRPKKVTYWPGSVVGDLRKVCNRLTKAHPWDIDEAIWFVLTDETPSVRPIVSKINSSWVPDTRVQTTLSLTIQPWVPPETVAAVYRQIQEEVLGGKCGRIGEKNLRLLEFATERTNKFGRLPRGDVLVQSWDRKWRSTHPEWCYDCDKRRFWRDLRSVQRSVTNSRRAGLLLDARGYFPVEQMPQN